ncbi:MAG: hypothetical protein M0R74_12755 [Dehalococcoidia bacterium]|nr:hypothetical protein [Dehalococcoidia bacterium]
MDNILRHAFVKRHCNECGGSYNVTLYDVLQEQRVLDEWQSGRPSCAGCSRELDQMVHQIPRESLESLAAAWDAVTQKLEQHSVEIELR